MARVAIFYYRNYKYLLTVTGTYILFKMYSVGQAWKFPVGVPPAGLSSALQSGGIG